MENNYIEYNNIKLKYNIFKKNTILFRTIISDEYTNKEPENNNILRDFIGKREYNKDFCISPYYNRYFYLNPYMADSNLYLNNKNDRKVYLYELQYDIKILSLLNVNYTIDDLIKNNILTKCNTINNVYCDYDKDLNNNDYCFTLDFMKTYPDILGFIWINIKDNKKLYESINNKKNRFITYNKLKKFFNFEKSYIKSDYKGIPELILHPYNKRIFENKIIKFNKSLYKNIIENIDKFNYTIIKEFDHQPFKIDNLYKYINSNKYLNYDNKKGIFIYKYNK